MRNSSKYMVLCSLFAALIAVCAWISVPVFDIAFTLQTLGIFLSLGLLGGKKGCAAIAIYLLLGAAGMPVFSGFRGGLGALIGVTGGFLWGFLLSGLTYWALERFGKLPAMIAGQLICYLCGCIWFYLYAGGGIWVILLRCVVPFLIPDAAKLYLAYILTRRLSRHIA
jgi:biotin transport system substrate-specific component